MKIKSGFELNTVMNENLIIAYGKENIDFSKVITLNESAAYIWNNVVGKEFTAKDIAELLCAEYEVAEEQALADAVTLMENWKSVGIAE